MAPAALAASAVLGKPVPLTGPAPVPPPMLDGQVRPIGFESGRPEDVTFRGKGEDGGAVLGASSVSSGDPQSKMFTWRQPGDEIAPPPRLDPNSVAPPRLEPSPMPTPPPPGVPSGGFPITPPPPGVVSGGTTATPGFGFLCGPDPLCAPAPSLSHSGTYPGNEIYVNAESLLWWMKGNPMPTLAVATTSPTPGMGSTLPLGNTHLGTDGRPGGRLTLGYWFDDEHYNGVEGGFFVLGRRNDSLSMGTGSGPTSPPFLLVPFAPAGTGPSAVVLTNPGGVGMTLSSSLWGGEFNYRTTFLEAPNGFLDLIAGMRTTALDETLNFDTLSNGGAGFMTHDQFRTQNRFYGGQVGAVGEWRICDLVLDVKAKLAMGTTQEMINSNGLTMMGTTATNAGIFSSFSNRGTFTRSQFSLLPEVGASLGWQYSEHVRFSLGYNIMYWSRVVRPGNQIDGVINPSQVPALFPATAALGSPPRPLIPFNASDFWAQGITLGVELRY